MKKFIICLLLATLCFSFSGCNLSDISLFSEQATIELMNDENEVTVNAGEKIDYYIKVNADDNFPIDEIMCISENNSVATAEYRHVLWESELHYYINGISQGETYIYFSTPNGKTQSEKLKVTVLPQPFSENALAQSNVEQETAVPVNTLFLQVGQTSNKFGFYISALGGVSKDNIKIVSENPNVATVWYDTLTSAEQIFFTVTGVSEGKTAVYLTNDGGTILSNKTEIVVEQPYTQATSTEVQSTTIIESSPVVITESVTATETTTAATTVREIPETVYITPTGKKYHFKATCAGKNATAVPLSDAKSNYEPCKKCAYE